MTVPTALSVPGARVLLVGTGTHQRRPEPVASARGSVPVPDIPAVATTVEGLRQVLIDQCKMDQSRLHVCVDPPDPRAFGELLTGVAAQAEDLLLFYYVGHGLVSHSGELYLATAATDDISDGLGYKALAYSQVREALLRCRARAVVVVLDCCFAGRADGSLGTPVADAFGSTYIRGTYLLASTARDETALAKPGERYTAFSGELHHLLRNGDEAGPPRLDLGHIYDYLCRALPTKGLPKPHRQAGGQTDHLVLAPNPAYQPPLFPVPPDPSPEGSGGSAGCPYQGLESFNDTDADYFFGRQQLIDKLCTELTTRLSDTCLLAVIGPSGSGKSSLLRAGLLPAIRNGKLRAPGSHSWPPLVLTPGEHPAQALASVLEGMVRQPRKDIHAELIADPHSLVAVLRRALREHAGARTVAGARLVLVIDQFEELFTACRDDDERKTFIQALCAACSPCEDAAETPAVVVFGLRADFYERCSHHQELVPALERHVLVDPMGNNELRDVIEKPAEVAGLALQSGLADLLLRDLYAGHMADSDSGGGLPLLSYALRATWQHREGRLLTMAGYQATGGIWESVARQADSIYERLGKELGTTGQEAARLLLLSLIQVGDGTTDTRRRVNLADLLRDRPTDEAAAIAVARDAFADPGARLITLDGDNAEITHEALVRAWPRLREWIDKDRTGLLAHQRLSEAADAWHRADRHPDALYRGTLLADAHAVADGFVCPLSPMEREFVQASDDAQHHEELVIRRRTRRLQQLVGALAILLTVALIATGIAFQARQSAIQESRIAISRQLAAMSKNFGPNDFRASRPRESMLLAAAAWRAADTEQARSALLSTQNQHYSGTLFGHGGGVRGVQFSPDGKLVATASADSTVRLWDVRSRRQVGRPLSGHLRPVNAVAFSPDGRILASASTDATVRLWDVKTGDQIGQPLGRPAATALEEEMFGAGGQVNDVVFDVVFSPDGRVLAAGGADKTIRLWDVATQRQIGQSLAGHEGPVHSLAFSSDGQMLASASGDKTVRLWDIKTHEQVGGPITGHSDSVNAVVFRPDGHTLASSSDDQTVRLWDVQTRRQIGSSLMVGDLAVDVTFSPNGRLLASTSVDKTVRLWDVETHNQVGQPLSGHTNTVNAVAFSPDGGTLASASDDRTVMLWVTNPSLTDDLSPVYGLAFGPQGDIVAAAGHDPTIGVWDVRTQRPIGQPLRGHTGPVYSLVFGPDGRTLASTSQDSTIRLWDVRTQSQIGEPLRGHTGPVRSAVFSPDGRTLASGGDDRTIRLWNVETHSQTGEPIMTEHSVWQVVFDHVGQTVASAAAAETALGVTVQFWDTKTLLPVGRPLAGHVDTVWSVEFSPDGRTLVTTSSDQTVILWDASTHYQIGEPITGHTDTVFKAAFGPNSDMLVTASLDTTVRLWTLKPRPVEWATLTGHDGWVNSVAFSPDGHTIGSVGGGPGRAPRMFLWDTDAEHVLNRMCQTLGTDFSPAESERYLSDLPFRKVCKN